MSMLAHSLAMLRCGGSSAIMVSSFSACIAADGTEKSGFDYSHMLRPIVGLQETASFIKTNCRDMLAAAKDTGRVLYRGYSSSGNIKGGSVVTERPDLFDANTYGSTLAAEYFVALDGYLKAKGSICAPSSGHVATPSSMVALQWGSVVNVWPLDDLRYVWLKVILRCRRTES